MIDYYKWIGLPHKLGADPDDGEGADCLVVAYKVLSSLDIYFPRPQPEWFAMVERKEWANLYLVWENHMEKTVGPAMGLLSMRRNRVTGFNIMVVVGDGALCVHHVTGVRWLPLSLVKGPFWKARRAPS